MLIGRALLTALLATPLFVGCADQAETESGPVGGTEQPVNLNDAFPEEGKTDTGCHRLAAWCPARALTLGETLAEQLVTFTLDFGEVVPTEVQRTDEVETSEDGNTITVDTRITVEAEASAFSIERQFGPYLIEVDEPGLMEVEIFTDEGDEGYFWHKGPEDEKFEQYDGPLLVLPVIPGEHKVAVWPVAAAGEASGGKLVGELKYSIQAKIVPTATGAP